MAVTRIKKEETLAELNDLFGRAKSVVFVKNGGLTVAEVSKMKRELRKGNAHAKVAKKTLMRIALKSNGMPEVDDSVLDGPIISVSSIDDEITGAKVVKGFMKDIKTIEFTGGVFNGVVYDGKQVLALANLPGKQELLARVVGGMKSPLNGLHHALSYHLRGLVTVLSKIQEQKA